MAIAALVSQCASGAAVDSSATIVLVRLALRSIVCLAVCVAFRGGTPPRPPRDLARRHTARGAHRRHARNYCSAMAARPWVLLMIAALMSTAHGFTLAAGQPNRVTGVSPRRISVLSLQEQEPSNTPATSDETVVVPADTPETDMKMSLPSLSIPGPIIALLACSLLGALPTISKTLDSAS